MIGYVTIGVSDMERAKKFYTGLFSDRDAKVIIDARRIAFIGSKLGEPMLAVCEPYDGGECSVGNGSMVAFAAQSKEESKALYDKAISLGATDEGEPGQRVPDRFYGSYVRDPDGNKLCFFVFG
ncbi:VOC family protein [Ruegeria sp. HKCCA5491]|uniref:VOC family protein n=1 Tax=Ruegeria sp. HKCCA5491 TaxID=2682986 RepID=UPI0014895953|nr:VOC family protein [Ruegeria sp. HKCCA5491]